MQSKLTRLGLFLARPRYLLFAGALSAFSAPPFHFLPFFWLACLPLVAAVFSLRKKALIFCIAAFFLTRYISSFYWIIPAPVFIVGDIGWALGFLVVLRR